MDIVIFRHGQTDWNIQGRLQGSTNTALNETGLAQAEALAMRLLGFNFDLVVTSDLMRAHDTAKRVVQDRAIPILVDSRLRELGLGEAEGMTLEEVKAKWGTTDFRAYDIPGRESTQSISERVNQVINECYIKKYKSIAISSHGGVVWNWLSLYATRDQVGKVGNTDAFHLKWDGTSATYLGRISNK